MPSCSLSSRCFTTVFMMVDLPAPGFPFSQKIFGSEWGGRSHHCWNSAVSRPIGLFRHTPDLSHPSGSTSGGTIRLERNPGESGHLEGQTVRSSLYGYKYRRNEHEHSRQQSCCRKCAHSAWGSGILSLQLEPRSQLHPPNAGIGTPPRDLRLFESLRQLTPCRLPLTCRRSSLERSTRMRQKIRIHEADKAERRSGVQASRGVFKRELQRGACEVRRGARPMNDRSQLYNETWSELCVERLLGLRRILSTGRIQCVVTRYRMCTTGIKPTLQQQSVQLVLRSHTRRSGCAH
jgi:hypothetical protein